MKLAAGVAVVLISGGMAFAQQMKNPGGHVPPPPGIRPHNTITLPPVNNSSAAQLAKIEQQTARVRTSQPVTHHPSNSVAATPALNLGKNKPIHVTRSPQPTNPKH